MGLAAHCPSQPGTRQWPGHNSGGTLLPARWRVPRVALAALQRCVLYLEVILGHITDQYSDRAICLKRLLALIIFSCLRFSATHILATSSFFLCSSLSSICFSPQRD